MASLKKKVAFSAPFVHLIDSKHCILIDNFLRDSPLKNFMITLSVLSAKTEIQLLYRTQ